MTRVVALALPEVNERLSHGAPCFFVRDKRSPCCYHDADFSSDGRASLWCPAPVGVQEELVQSEPERFFKPPTAKGTLSSWLWVFLDTSGKHKADWNEIAAILEDAYREVAPKRSSPGSTADDTAERGARMQTQHGQAMSSGHS